MKAAFKLAAGIAAALAIASSAAGAAARLSEQTGTHHRAIRRRRVSPTRCPASSARSCPNKWGVPVVIENRPGAAGNIGMESGARSAPDGYTLMLAPTGNLTVNPILFPKLPFDTYKDFAPVTVLATSPNVLVVQPRACPRTAQGAASPTPRPIPASSISLRPAPAAARTWPANC